MSIIILIPAVVCAVALCVWSPSRVFRTIALPVIVLLPVFYFWKVALLPPINVAEGVLWPLGIVAGLRHWRRWRFSWCDVWVLLFVLSTGVADRMLGRATNSVFEVLDGLGMMLIPYGLGKLLIEQEGARAGTLKAIVQMLCAAAVIAFYEFRSLRNPFRGVLERFFQGQQDVWTTQIRNGFGRITGPYADAELAGMVFLLGLLLALYLARTYGWGGRFHGAPALLVRKWTVAAGVLLMALLMTQSRGPELGLLFAAPIAFVGRSRNVRRASVLAAAFIFVGGGLAYAALSRYAASKTPTSEQQETAAYRAVLIEDYVPLAERSGAWGFGPQFPTIGKYQSIDNEYLLVALTQGYVGLGAFLLFILGTLYHLLAAAIYISEPADRAFAFTLLGVFAGMLVTIATVFLDFQPLIFFFLVAGWSQALRVRRAGPVPLPFRQVYT